MSPQTAERAEALSMLPGIRYGRVAMSRHALPFVTIARHIVDSGDVLIRIHRGFGYHTALDGSVVAYEAGNLETGADDVWSVQFVGEARVVEPTDAQLTRFGPCTARSNGEPFVPVYLRIEPEFVSVHWFGGVTHA
ncbi:pyridoxamine 5'-phosphate oxidase family protein [Streptomyces sp. NPDC048172]|uniref:pyridoxamine 5'-phosphate oxidase family protein n=1 Tax=Streptomyces sp. NPDC048172 TaxID=3365505 RepID=UPI003723C7FC